LVKFNKR